MTFRPQKKLALALEANLVQDNLPVEVYKNIYIGSIHAAFNQEALQERGITHILNVSRLPSTFPKHFTYLSIDVRDKDDANLLACIPASNIFIEAGADNGGVLVHCYGGRSRSSALIAAFLMSSFGWNYHDVFAMIKRVRPVADINHGFQAQLKAYAIAKYDVYIAQQVLLRGRLRALQSYRSINGTTEQDIDRKNCERQKFGSLPMNGGEKSRSSKRSWASSKQQDEDDAESEEDQEDSLVAIELSSPGGINGTTTDRASGNARVPLIVTKPQQLNANANQSILRKQIPLMDPRSPRCRLSRPGSTSVRVIPPLRGLERVFCCSWCSSCLFNLASVIRTDIDILPLLDQCSAAEKKDKSHSNDQEEMIIEQGQIGGGSKQIENRMSVDENDHKWSEDAEAESKHIVVCKPPTTMRGSRGSKAFVFDDSVLNSSSNTSFAPSAMTTSFPLPTSNNIVEHHHQQFSSVQDMEISTTPSPALDIKQSPIDEPVDMVMISESPRSHKLSADEKPVLTLDALDSDLTTLTRPPSIRVRSGSCSGSGDRNFNGQQQFSPRVVIGEDSPRIQVPPHRLNMTSSPRDPHWSGMPRPQSAEKRRWLARVSLLRMNSKGNGGEQKVAKMAKDDDDAMILGLGEEKYFYLEYLEWMGQDILSSEIEEGDIHCGHCKKVLGHWTWKPQSKASLGGKLETPIIRILKKVVHSMDMPMDATPISTPRINDEEVDSSMMEK